MTLDDMIEHSFRNFHVKGFDYLCIKRTPTHTRKVYFFEGDVAQLPEIVNPHDHRYHFTTTILTGVMSNSIYVPDDKHGDTYNEFEWRTPLLNQKNPGFTWQREIRLLEQQRLTYVPREWYHLYAHDFHTIRMHSDTTVIVLDQYEDVVPADQPTRTFMQDRRPPSLDGLYEKFTPDQLIARLEQYKQLIAP